MIRLFRTLSPLLAPLLTWTCGAPGAGPERPTASSPDTGTYHVYVGAESADLMHRVRFSPDSATVEHTVPVGEMATETEGPHGFRASPDGEFLYMTTGHGVPDGKLWKFRAGPDTLVAPPILLGRFPATLDLTPDGLYAFVANFNLHGDRVPSTLSVVYTPDMVEVEQIETCVQPHGARMGPDGIFVYSACVFADQLVEIDTRSYRVARRFSVDLEEMGPLDPGAVSGSGERGPSCGPTWAVHHPVQPRIYVACNAADRILVVDSEAWEIADVIRTGRGPYNLALTPDGGLLVATLKQGGGVEFVETASGRSLARRESSTTVTHGVVISPDGRYAFTSVEGVGAEPGKVDIWDLASFRRVADVEVGQQAGGITFWRQEP